MYTYNVYIYILHYVYIFIHFIIIIHYIYDYIRMYLCIIYYIYWAHNQPSEIDRH